MYKGRRESKRPMRRKVVYESFQIYQQGPCDQLIEVGRGEVWRTGMWWQQLFISVRGGTVVLCVHTIIELFLYFN